MHAPLRHKLVHGRPLAISLARARRFSSCDPPRFNAPPRLLLLTSQLRRCCRCPWTWRESQRHFDAEARLLAVAPTSRPLPPTFCCCPLTLMGSQRISTQRRGCCFCRYAPRPLCQTTMPHLQAVLRPPPPSSPPPPAMLRPFPNSGRQLHPDSCRRHRLCWAQYCYNDLPRPSPRLFFPRPRPLVRCALTFHRVNVLAADGRRRAFRDGRLGRASLSSISVCFRECLAPSHHYVATQCMEGRARGWRSFKSVLTH